MKRVRKSRQQLRTLIREMIVCEVEVPDELLGKLIGSAEGLDAEDPAVSDLISQSLEDDTDLLSKTLEKNPEALQDMLGDSPGMLDSVSDFFKDNPDVIPPEVTDTVVTASSVYSVL